MLFEDDVIDAVCKKLKDNGYVIKQKLNTTQQGYDIIAEKSIKIKRLLFIEAKGETSSRKGSARYGKPFDRAQVRIHVAEALFKSAEAISKEQFNNVETKIGIALPVERNHLDMVESILPVIEKLDITLFWVHPDKKVEVVSPWNL